MDVTKNSHYLWNSMRFFNIDLHISVIADLKQIFGNLGHRVIDKTLSDHSFVFGRKRDTLDVISKDNWVSIDKSLCDRFYERYKDELSEYDGFICTYPPSFSLLYEKFQKPIILQVPIRFEVPFQNDSVKVDLLKDYLRNGIDSSQIIPIANNLYDKKYCEESIDRGFHYIPNYCEYTGIYYIGGENFVLSSMQDLGITHKNIVEKDKYLGQCYNWEKLKYVRGVIVIPYNISTMSVFEYYTANIPMMFPTPEFCEKLYKEQKALTQLSWTPTNKNTLDWIRLADFYSYDMPHITYFESIEHLYELVETLDVYEISEKMKKFNIIRKDRIYKKWNEILCRM